MSPRIFSCGTRIDVDQRKPALVFVGDSITYGLGVSGYQAFPALVEEVFPGYCCPNMGYPGGGAHVLIEHLANFGKDYDIKRCIYQVSHFDRRPDPLRPLHDRSYTFLGGMSFSDGLTEQHVLKAMEEEKDDHQRLLDMISRYPEPPVIIVCRYTSDIPVIERYTDEWFNWVVAGVVSRGFELLDLGSFKNLLTLHEEDCHLTAQGHRHVADLVIEKLTHAFHDL